MGKYSTVACILGRFDMPKKLRPVPKKKPLGKTHIRAWRDHRNLTLEGVVERLDAIYGEDDTAPATAASLSRVERGQQPYSQPLLEALAEALGTTPANLIMHPPGAEDELRIVWSQLSPSGQRQALTILKALKDAAA